MDTLSWCIFLRLRLRLYFVEIVDLVDLTCPVAEHMRCISIMKEKLTIIIKLSLEKRQIDYKRVN